MATLAAPKTADWKDAAPSYLAGAAAATSVVSIAASQILLGMALVALMVAPHRLRLPRIGWPLTAFMGWTLVSWIASASASGDFAQGLPQIKKFYVYLMLWAVFSGIRSAAEVRWVVLGWAVGGTLSACTGFVQGALQYLNSTAPEFFYFSYSNNRITGFMDHWMTFAGTMMLMVMMTGAALLFGPRPLFSRQQKMILGVACATTALALLVGYSRSMWMGGAAGVVWLLWAKRRWTVLLVPAAVAILVATNALNVRERIVDTFDPQIGTMNTTEHRIVLWASGWEMVKANPLLGVGPERVGENVERYLPAWVEQPIPAEWYTGHLHNFYVHYAAERGVPALLAMLAFLAMAFWALFRAVRRTPPESENYWVLHGAIASIIAMMVGGIGEVNMGDSEVLGTFLAIVACGYAVATGPQYRHFQD